MFKKNYKTLKKEKKQIELDKEIKQQTKNSLDKHKREKQECKKNKKREMI